MFFPDLNKMCACACLEGESKLEEIMKLPVTSLGKSAHAPGDFAPNFLFKK
jgi:hypothetical protein